MLTRGNTIELASSGSFKAFKKNTNEKKLGIPKTMPQKKLFNCNEFFDFIL